MAAASAVDEGDKAGDEDAMDLPDEARTLWDAATALNQQWRAMQPVARGGRTVSCVGDQPGLVLPPLLFMTDPLRTPEPWTTAAALPAGACVVFRHFGARDAAATAERLRETTRRAGVLLLIGRDADLAERVGADGVHLPERDLGRAPDLRRQWPDWLLTGACHGEPNETDGLDALVMSPVFPAGGASAVKTPMGMEAFAARVEKSPLPVYALGGITAGNVGQLAASGACGIAGVAAIREAFAASTPKRD